MIGDLLANALVATLAAALTAWLIGGSWGMIPGMLVGMVIGMFIALPVSLLMLAPLLGAAEKEGGGIFWIYYSSCAYAVTPTERYQATHDLGKALGRETEEERREIFGAKRV